MRSNEGSLAQKLIANTLLNFMGQLYVLALGIAVVPYLVHRLGAGLYGLTVIVAALGSFAGVLNLGIGRALSKYAAELCGRGDPERIHGLLQTALFISLVAGTAGCFLVIKFRNRISAALFHGDPVTEPFATFALVVVALGILLSLASDCFSGITIGFQRFDIYNRMNVLGSTVRNLGSILVLAFGLFVKAVFLVYLLASLAVLLGYAYYARKLIPGPRLGLKFSWTDFKLLFSFSASVVVTTVSTLMVHRLDRLLVAYYLPIAAVAFYAVPYSLAEKTWMGVGNITSVIFPSSSELAATCARQKLQELYLRATKMVIMAALPVTILLVVLPAQILQHYVGAEFANRGAFTMQLLAAGFLINILAHVPFVVAQGIGRPWVAAAFSLTSALVNLVLLFVLIQRFGIVGAGAGFLVSQALVMPLFIWNVNRALDVSWRSLVSRAYLRPFACGICAVGLLWGLRPYADSLLKLGLFSSLVLLVYAVLALTSVMDTRERVGIFHEILTIFRRGQRVVNA